MARILHLYYHLIFGYHAVTSCTSTTVVLFLNDADCRMKQYIQSYTLSEVLTEPDSIVESTMATLLCEGSASLQLKLQTVILSLLRSVV
jgi:hypothetical protein